MYYKERIKEIIAYLLDQDFNEPMNPEEMNHELERMGYAPDEIRQAMNMIDLEPGLEDHRPKQEFLSGTRILGESEKHVLSTDAQGYLLKMLKLRVLTEIQLGLIIESAGLEFMPPVSLEEIKDITSRFVFAPPEDGVPGSAGSDGWIH